MKNPYLHLLGLQSSGEPMVIATVARAIGSTPQKPGSSALFNAKGLIAGTIGGGIVECKIQQIALQALTNGESGYYQFNLNKQAVNGEDAICGGKIEILIDASPRDHFSVFNEINHSLEQKIPGVLVTTVKSVPGNTSIERVWVTQKSCSSADHQGGLIKEVQRMIAEKDSGQYCEFKQSDPQRTVFLESMFPPARLLIIGAGHIGKALSQLGKFLGFEVTVVDDRIEYANRDNLPDADHVLTGDIAEIMGEINLTPDTYVVIVTRGHKDDAKALRECIGGEAAYVGMIGSRNKVAVMREEFMKKGWAEPREWKDIHAPIGLDIHSKSVEEIAVSIAAQLVQVKNAKVQVHV